MRKSILILLISFFSFQGFAQHPDLLINDWYLTNIVINGNNNIPNFEDYYYLIYLQFDDDGIGADFKTTACEVLYAEIIYENNSEFNLSNISQPQTECEADFEEFKNLYFNFFYDNIENSFNYLISENNDIKYLEITDANGNKAYYENKISTYPFLDQTWYLTNLFGDLGNDINVSDINPPINPHIKINESLDFTGFGACNSFLGNFIIDDGSITAINFEQTNYTCINQEHTRLESEYFVYFSIGDTLLVLYQEINEIQYLYLYSPYPGYYLEFQNVPLLGNEDFKKNTVEIYPNPASNTLFISSENTVIERFTVYSISGKIVLDTANETNSIDVSGLSNGMYFIEIYSKDGRSLQKFIKR